MNHINELTKKSENVMDDTTTLSKIHVGMNVIIRLLSNPAETSEGVIARIVSEDDEPKGIIVILENGKKGNIWKINNSDEIIKKRICNENQFTENKETFGELPMKQKVIPQTIQSFLNSEGGYLYIGVKDIGTLEERLVGLTTDRKIIEAGSDAKKWFEKEGRDDLPDEKFEDFFEMELQATLGKYLACAIPIAPLIELKWPEINGIKILEIHIPKILKPVFFRNLSKHGEIRFDIKYMNKPAGQRYLDDFYVRRGGSREPIDKSQDIYEYIKNRV